MRDVTLDAVLYLDAACYIVGSNFMYGKQYCTVDASQLAAIPVLKLSGVSCNGQQAGNCLVRDYLGIAPISTTPKSLKLAACSHGCNLPLCPGI